MAEPGTAAFIAQYNFARAIRAGTSYGGPGSPRITGQQLSDAAQTNTSEYLRLVSIQAAQEIYQGNPGAGPHYALSAKAQKDREEAQRYAQLSAGVGAYNPNSVPTSPQKPGTPPPIIQMQQARDPRTGSWSARVQAYTNYLQRTSTSNPTYARNEAIAWIGPDPAAVTVKAAPVKPQPTIQMQQARDPQTGSWSARVQAYTDYLLRTSINNSTYARNEAIAWIGPDPAAVTVKAAPVKTPLQVAEEARLAQQARDRETARLDEISRAMTAAKNPAAASAAEFAQQIAAFGNAPAPPPPPAIPKPTYAKPIDVRDPITLTLETVAAREASAVAAVREAIANGAVLASIVAKVQPKKNQPKKTKGSKSGSKRPITKLKK